MFQLKIYLSATVCLTHKKIARTPTSTSNFHQIRLEVVLIICDQLRGYLCRHQLDHPHHVYLLSDLF